MDPKLHKTSGVSQEEDIASLRLELIETQRIIEKTEDVESLDALHEVRRNIVNEIYRIREHNGEKLINPRRWRSEIGFLYSWLNRHWEMEHDDFFFGRLSEYENSIDRYIKAYSEHPELPSEMV